MRSFVKRLLVAASMVAAGACVSATPTVEMKEERIVKGERAPCVSLPLDKFQRCGCHPRVSSAIDIMDSAGLPESARAELERCLSGDTAAKINIVGKEIADVEGALKTCISQKVAVNESVIAVLGQISETVTSQPASAAEMCNWSRCVYGPDAQCEGG